MRALFKSSCYCIIAISVLACQAFGQESAPVPAPQKTSPSEQVASEGQVDAKLAESYSLYLKALQDGSYAEAVSQWNSMTRLNWSVEFKNYIGQRLRNELDAKKTLAALEVAVEANPNDLILQQCLGSLRMQHGHHSRAIANYDKAVDLEPKNAWNYFFRAYCNQEWGARERVEIDAGEAIRLEPKNATFLYFRGYARALYLNKSVDGLADLSEALALEPNCWEYLLGRATARHNAQDYQGAIADATAALATCDQPDPPGSENDDPSKPRLRLPRRDKLVDCYRTRSNSNVKLKDYPAAIDDLNRAIELGSDAHPHLYVDRADVKVLQKDYAGALADYNLAAQKNDFYDKNEKRAWVNLQLGNYQAALDEYNRLIPPGGGSFECLMYRGITKQRMGRFDEAMADFDAVLDTGLGSAEAYVARGLLKREIHDAQGAMQDFNDAITKNQKHADAYYQRGLLGHHEFNFEAALLDYDKVIALDANHFGAHFNRGIVLRSLNKDRAAINSFSKAIAIDPAYARSYFLRGLTKQDLKDYAAAIADFDMAIERTSGSIAPIMAKSILLSTCEDTAVRNAPVSLDLAQKCIDAEPKDPRAMNAMALAHAANGNFDAAVEWESKAMQDGAYAKDAALNGGKHSPERIAAWKSGKLWTMPTKEQPTRP